MYRRMLVWNITRFYGASFACKNFQIPVYMYTHLYSKLLPGKTVDSISASFIQHPFHYILQQCTSMHYSVTSERYTTLFAFSLYLYLLVFSIFSLVSIFVFSLSFRQSLSSFFLYLFVSLYLRFFSLSLSFLYLSVSFYLRFFSLSFSFLYFSVSLYLRFFSISRVLLFPT